MIALTIAMLQRASRTRHERPFQKRMTKASRCHRGGLAGAAPVVSSLSP